MNAIVRIAAIAVSMAVPAGMALAQDVGVSISLGEPGFYGRIDVGSAPPPVLVDPRPIVIQPGVPPVEPIYLRVPKAHRDHWRRYCARYNACDRPVLFVEDRWYRDVYVPHYRSHREEFRSRDERREEHRDRGRHEGRPEGRGPDDRRMEERHGDDRR